MRKTERFPTTDEQDKPVSIKAVIRARGDIQKAIRHNMRFYISKSKKNLPDYNK